MSHPQGAAANAEIELPFGKSFAVEISSDNYPSNASLILSNDDGMPVVRYRVGSKENPILEQIVAIRPLNKGLVQFVFTLDFPTQAQMFAGYIPGNYTFSFAPPGSKVTSFFGTVKDPHPPDSLGEEDNWTAKAGGPIDDETAEY